AGNLPSRYTSARRRASSLSVLRLRCLNFQASLVVLATRHFTPFAAHRSQTQPAKRQASRSTTAGPCLSSRRAISARLVGRDRKRQSSAERYRQTTLLYLPRSMARMGAAVVVAVVVIVQAPWGDGWWKCGNSHVTTPHGLHGFFRPSRDRSCL